MLTLERLGLDERLAVDEQASEECGWTVLVKPRPRVAMLTAEFRYAPNTAQSRAALLHEAAALLIAEAEALT